MAVFARAVSMRMAEIPRARSLGDALFEANITADPSFRGRLSVPLTLRIPVFPFDGQPPCSEHNAFKRSKPRNHRNLSCSIYSMRWGDPDFDDRFDLTCKLVGPLAKRLLSLGVSQSPLAEWMTHLSAVSCREVSVLRQRPLSHASAFRANAPQ